MYSTANNFTDIVPVVPASSHSDERLHVDDDGQVEDDEADLWEDNDVTILFLIFGVLVIMVDRLKNPKIFLKKQV